MNSQGELVGFQHKLKTTSVYYQWEEQVVAGLRLHLGDDTQRWTQKNANNTDFHDSEFLTDFYKLHTLKNMHGLLKRLQSLYTTKATLTTEE